MKPKTLVVSLIAVLLCVAANANARDTVEQLGKGVGSTCGTWTAERKTSTQWFSAANWVLGFMSGAASALDRDLLDGLDSNAVLGWMDNYCRAHPLDQIADGATSLLETRANAR
ncbi:MAG: hypothetical protein EPN57_18375 [Paraburkholderia sp.]|nr:MAG: hypothetical protein EPN57_18375 [Paraburkholderia sp.]